VGEREKTVCSRSLSLSLLESFLSLSLALSLEEDGLFSLSLSLSQDSIPGRERARDRVKDREDSLLFPEDCPF